MENTQDIPIPEVVTIDKPLLVQQDITDPNRDIFRLSLSARTGLHQGNLHVVPALAFNDHSFRTPADQVHIPAMNRIVLGRETNPENRGVCVNIGGNKYVSGEHLSITGDECRNISETHRVFVLQATGFNEGEIMWNPNELKPNHHTPLSYVVENAEDPTRIGLTTVNIFKFPTEKNDDPNHTGAGQYVLYFQPDRTNNPDLWHMMRIADPAHIPPEIKAKLKKALIS